MNAVRVALAIGVIGVLTACGGHNGSTSLPAAPSQGASQVTRPASASGVKIHDQTFALEGLTKGTSTRAVHASIGNSQPATADPPVAHPAEAPCVVNLFTNESFPTTNFNLNPFNYTPSCPGPWAKVVFSADFNMSAGTQFDRTFNVWLAGANLYFGTSPEPDTNLSPSWHVERDVTDLASILTTAQTGSLFIGNVIEPGLNGVPTASASLLFYPATERFPAPRTADVVFPLSSGPAGGSVFLNTQTDSLSGTFTFPTNVERAYLDLYLQSQASDEFWYTCVPNDVTSELQSCGNTALREGEVAIDGQPAGVAPIYPWIYTGGIDPFLWQPIPGVETFDFVPYRVDLTPFAAILSNGSQHTVAVSVVNANSGFSTTGNLLLYLDHGSVNVTGALVTDTTSGLPTETVIDNVKNSNGNISGPLTVDGSHLVAVDGFVNTSHGRVETKVTQSIAFASNQQFTINSSQFVQDIKQDTKIVSNTNIISSKGAPRFLSETQEWPLTLDIAVLVQPSGNFTQTTTSQQIKKVAIQSNLGSDQSSSNEVNTTDTLNFDSSGNFTGNSNQKSGQHYFTAGTNGCYDKTIMAANNILTSSMQACNNLK